MDNVMLQKKRKAAFLDPVDSFIPRHIGPSDDEIDAMLAEVGFDTLDALTSAVVPKSIQLKTDLNLPLPKGERAVLEELRTIASRNEVRRSFIGMGYHDCVTPPVILRNVLENPCWYTQYTPYQAELAQGRLEALLNFQTMVSDLTGLPLSNASLLDEGTAAAEAMTMCRSLVAPARNVFFVAADCHPQTIEVVKARARLLGIDVQIGDPTSPTFNAEQSFGILLQYPSTEGQLYDHGPVIEVAHAGGALAVVACDLLALTLVRPPGEFGADIAVGTSQRFGVPLGYGGPHAAFLSTHDRYRRQIPGRIVGVSKDDTGRPALRLALQTREQHIRRDKATSNICTAQALLAIIASMYAVYHGPTGLQGIARRVHGMAATLAEALRRVGFVIADVPFFDTLKVGIPVGAAGEILARADAARINLRQLGPDAICIALDETATASDLQTLVEVFAGKPGPLSIQEIAENVKLVFPAPFSRTSSFLEQEVFESHHSEHEMLRYLQRLQAKELSLAHSMIPLGSCTMKLNATSEMIPVTWAEFGALHPFVPRGQANGYLELFGQLEGWLCEITGFHAASLQPNAGAQGEYAGLAVIRAWHEHRGETDRDVCLIPTSAHGTNPASAVMVGMKVVLVRCLDDGSIDLEDLTAKAAQHRERLAALMMTYPSTHGVFEESVREVCDVIHEHGGQVYLDGANMNAQIGLCRPGDYGADVCHLNLHKTFCIPHGGGGPGMGPIAVAEHLAAFLPGHPLLEIGGELAIGPVSAAPYGSSSILPISWTYIAMMGADGLRKASQVAVLNANYMASRIGQHYPVVYRGRGGLVAHEFIIDLRPLKDAAGITPDDVAKRLMDFGFHAPTMSWPVAGTLMIEPTESESRAELDRFCDAMRIIRDEIREIEEGRADREDNPLKHAPHTAQVVASDGWNRSDSRDQAAYPAPWVRERKFWPPIGRIDNVWGDRNLVCSCPPLESYE